MKALKVTGGLLLGLFLLVVMGYVVLCFINWNDRPPSAAAREFQQMVDTRPAVAPADNGVVYLLGFSAPDGADPVEVGTRRMAWLEAVDENTDPKTDPLREELHFRDLGSPVPGKLREACSPDSDLAPCAAVFESAAHDWKPNSVDVLAVRRYEALLTRHDWKDVVPLHVSAPLPAYSEVMHAQRLYLLRAMQLASSGKTLEARAKLSADLEYWRGAVPAADILLSQMIGVAALRNHFFYSSLILRSVPAAQVGDVVPDGWSREFSAAERSMRRVMAGEVAFSARNLRDTVMPVYHDQSVEELLEGSTFLDRWIGRLSRPLLKVQDTVNGMAEKRLRICTDFEAPMQQYPQLKRRWKEQPSKPFSVYNPAGRILVWMDAGETYANYAMRTASVEGMRRAALLTAQLHARGTAPGAVADELARAELRDPYTDKPFQWDAARRSVIFTAPESHMWHKVEYFY